jgi:hypothetical protein
MLQEKISRENVKRKCVKNIIKHEYSIRWVPGILRDSFHLNLSRSFNKKMTAATIEFTGCFQKECERELFKAS